METPITESIEKLKSEFYEWCFLLSLDEIASNDVLRFMIERVERTLFIATGKEEM